MKNLRSIEVKMSLPNIKSGTQGYFHKWADMLHHDSSLEYPLRKTVALIEFPDGDVKLLDPENIRFTEPYSHNSH